MMKQKKYLLIVAPLVAMIITFIFSLASIPSAQTTVKNLPLAIINTDEGMLLLDGSKQLAGEQLVNMVKELAQNSETPAIKWTILSNLDEMHTAFSNKTYYGALYIPHDFTINQASLLTAEPNPATLELYINQGANPTAATIATQMLQTLVSQINNNVQQMMYTQIEQQGMTINSKSAQAIAKAIQANLSIVHPVGENSMNGNSPMSMLQPTWMASMLSALLIFLGLAQLSGHNKKFNLKYHANAIVIGIISSVLIGLSLTVFAKYLIGVTINDFTATAFIISLASLAYIMLLLACLSYIGIGVMPLFILLLFFGAPLLAIPPEMMSDLYRNWIYPWLPMRFMIDGLRDVFFFNTGFSWTSSTTTLLAIAILSITLVLLAATKRQLIKNDKIYDNNK